MTTWVRGQLTTSMSDSCIDVILLGTTTTDGLPCRATESLDKVLCSKSHYCVDSSHDVLVSTILLQQQPELQKSCDNIKAPRIEYSKHKILWTEDGISAYQQLLSHALPPLQHDYCDVSEPEIASVLFK